MTKQEKTIQFLESLGLDIDFTQIDYDNVTDFDSLYDELRDASLLDVEIIFYSRAMEFLTENDNSLNESLEIASEYGFDLKNLNSEKLASLLATRMLEEAFCEKRDEINEFFEELKEEEADEEESAE